jgi:BASS family bile acid:Na+ symporter
MTLDMFDFYPRYEETFAQVQLILFMVGMGATLSLRDFIDVFSRPRSLIVAFLGHILVMPLVALAVNHLFGLTGGIALGLILTAAMPGGALSKAFAYLGRGNVPLAIALTVVSTLATLVTVPLTLTFLAREYIPADFTMPTSKIVHDVVVYLLAPLIGGMILGNLYPQQRYRIGRIAIRLGFLVVVAIVVCSLGSGRIEPGSRGWRVPFAIIVFGLVGMQLNMLPFRLLGWPRPDTLTAGIEVTMRNMNLALLLKTGLFPAEASPELAQLGAEVLFVILFYAATAMVEGLPLTLRFRRKALANVGQAVPDGPDSTRVSVGLKD